jgi:hypothetical protein
MVISLTPKLFNKYWRFLRYQVDPSQRQQIINFYWTFKDLVDENTELEIAVNK